MSVSRAAEFAKMVFDRTINSNTFGKCLKNIKLVSVGDGNCKAEFTVQDEHLNLGGTLHGGFTSTLIDCISTYAVMTHGNGSPGVSVDLHVTFMKAAFPGDNVFIDARTIRAGKSLAFLEVELKKDDGAIIARGQHTKFIASG
ncbi:acyl-coenzyme A thioesterase 13-like [Belonocnema kinseyi]|uniref:acyl-coenzyme A thioesterase 13-like n=1 Tax=Belonocnema kinseyi TaxID=2817044 RepID=UPI00143D3AE5|nr:acyl-coenzyme A thioesterase 13-like [Belonocnema kinseyi]